jgi:hypothetical protein
VPDPCSAAGDQRRLGATIPASPHQQLEEHWIEKFRAASANRQQPRNQLFRLVGALGLFGLALASTIYLFQFHWLK